MEPVLTPAIPSLAAAFRFPCPSAHPNSALTSSFTAIASSYLDRSSGVQVPSMPSSCSSYTLPEAFAAASSSSFVDRVAYPSCVLEVGNRPDLVP